MPPARKKQAMVTSVVHRFTRTQLHVLVGEGGLLVVSSDSIGIELSRANAPINCKPHYPPPGVDGAGDGI